MDRHVSGGAYHSSEVAALWRAPGGLGLFREMGALIVECSSDASPDTVDELRRLFPEATVVVGKNR
jgi:hypothetical protein